MTASVLYIQIFEFDNIIKDDIFISKLKNLTLGYGGGMMTQITRFQKMKANNQSINARAVVGYLGDKPIAWALFSKEETMTTSTSFIPEDGFLVYIFTDFSYRRNGFGSKILTKCKELAGNEKLCICPWDKNAALFFYNNKQHDLFNALEYKQSILGEEHGHYF